MFFRAIQNRPWYKPALWSWLSILQPSGLFSVQVNEPIFRHYVECKYLATVTYLFRSHSWLSVRLNVRDPEDTLLGRSLPPEAALTNKRPVSLCVGLACFWKAACGCLCSLNSVWNLKAVHVLRTKSHDVSVQDEETYVWVQIIALTFPSNPLDWETGILTLSSFWSESGRH